MDKIIGIPAFKDNYIWLWVNSHHSAALVVDPGAAKPVLDWLTKEKLSLAGILITHHHSDHTGGILELVEQTQAPVYGGLHEPIPGLTQPLREGDQIHFEPMGVSFDILDIPGHTLGHIAYYNDQLIFSGDTLFAGGCGRLFEGSPEQMLSSLTKIKSLPPSTQIYCGHEYTLSNLQFAKQVEPNNLAIQKRLQTVQALRDQGLPTLPAPLAIELETNPFLRTDQPNVIKAIEEHFKTTFTSKAQIFLAIREWKNQFRN